MFDKKKVTRSYYNKITGKTVYLNSIKNTASFISFCVIRSVLIFSLLNSDFNSDRVSVYFGRVFTMSIRFEKFNFYVRQSIQILGFRSMFFSNCCFQSKFIHANICSSYNIRSNILE